MIIKEVNAINIKTHTANTPPIKFQRGLNVLLGRVGSGKSTILDSIMFGLYGWRGIKFKNLITKGKSDFRIEIIFEHEGKDYRVVRGEEDYLELLDNGYRIASGHRKVTEEIERIVGISRDQFQNLFYATQGEIARLITGSPEERQKIIDRLLGLESLREAYDWLKEPAKANQDDLNKLKEEIARLDGRLQGRSLEQLEEEKREKEKLVEDFASQIEELEDKIKKIEESLSSIKEKVKECEEFKEEIEKLNKKIEQINIEINVLREELSRLDPASIKKEIEHLKNDLEKLEGKIERLSDEEKFLIRERDHSIVVLEGSFSQIKEELDTEIKNIREEYEYMKGQMDEKRGEAKKIVKQKKELEKLEAGPDALCPLCRRPLTEEHKKKVIEELELELDKLKAKINVFEEEVKEKSNILKEKENTKKEREESIRKEIKEKYDEYEAKLNSVREDLRKLRDLYSSKKTRKDELEKKLEETTARKQEYVSKIKEYELEKNHISLELNGVIRDSISRLGIEGLSPIEELTQLKQNFEEERSKLTSDKENLSVLKTKIESDLKVLNREIEELKSLIEDAKAKEEKKKDLDVVEEANHLAGDIREKFKEARELIRVESLKVLQAQLEDLFLGDNRLYVHGDFHKVNLKENYEITVENPYGEISIDTLSGGQKAIVSLAFRFAVAKALAKNFETWLVDEPTESLGDEDVDQLANVLAYIQEIPQIIVATHHPELARNAHAIRVYIENGETKIEY
ncbi:MAG: AAA family ATPase [Candidatus Hydrothermarchaeota archaeon]